MGFKVVGCDVGSVTVGLAARATCEEVGLRGAVGDSSLRIRRSWVYGEELRGLGTEDRVNG